MEMGIHKTAKFIKKVDELQELDMPDRLSLFKQACLELAMCFWAGRVKDGLLHFPEDNTYSTNLWECVKLAKRDLIIAKKRFFMKYNEQNLTDSEKALFSLLIITAPG